MLLEPASVEQIRRGKDGRMALIDADAGGVAEELKRIDPGLKVRFAETGNPPFWAIIHEDGPTTSLVLTVRAFQGPTGAWGGLDHRIVERIREIDGHGRSGYDYAKELERHDARVREDAKAKFREAVEMDRLAHAARKDLGIKNKAFIPKDVPKEPA